MQIFTKIINKTQIINIDDNEENKIKKLNELLEEITNFNRNFFWLKSCGKVLKPTTILKHETNVELCFKPISYQKLYVEKSTIFNNNIYQT